MKKLFGVVLISLSVAACGGGSGEKAEAPAPKSMINNKAEERPAAKPADVPEVAEIVIEGNDQMKFNLDKIEVYEGQKVKLTLKHVGEMPLQSMGHNWTLLTKGVDVMEFGAATATAKETDYLPAGRENDVIAKTKTIGGGEEVTIEFDAPTRGMYTFICAFPGHYAMMKGRFLVK